MSPEPLGRETIASLIPHAGAMCLLSSVKEWNDTAIACEAEHPRAAGHPLAVAGRLPALCGLEYAAQGMALHGALTAAVAGRPRAGFIASVRGVRFERATLDGASGPLLIDAEKLAGDGAHVMYRFRVRAGEDTILTGRAAVVLDGDPT